MTNYTIRKWAILLAIIFAIVIEYYLIIVETFVNFNNAFGNWGGFWLYVILSFFTLGFLRFAFRRIEMERFVKTFAFALLIVIPIGVFWSLVQGYIADQLFNPEWQFTHDFVYVCIVSQFVILALLLLGTKDIEDIEAEKERSQEFIPEFKESEDDLNGW